LGFYTSEDGRSIGVDIKNDLSENVIATGIFSGELQIDQANGSQLFNSNSLANIYVAQFTKCGYINWEKQIGNGTGNCYVKALNLDPVSQDVYICGDLSGGVIYFEGMNGSILAIANPSSLYRESFLARLDAATGNCLWVSKIANSPTSSRNINAEAICVDDNGYAYIFGDYEASNVVFYNSNNLPTLVNVSNLGVGADNYLVVYDAYGFPMVAENAIMSTTNNDEAGAVDCYPNSIVYNSANVLITGSINNSFLGQLWVYDPGGNTLSIESSLSIGAGSMYFGKSVETLPTSASTRHAYIGGWVNLANGGSRPFIGRWELSNSNQILIPFSEQMSFINSSYPNENKSTDIDINLTNGDVYFAGLMNMSGAHPLPLGPVIPPQGFVSDDIYLDKFGTIIGDLNPFPNWSAWSTTNNCNFGFFNDLPAFAISSENDGKAFMTGGFSGYVLNWGPMQGVPVIAGGSTSAYIARVLENYGNVWIKDKEIQAGFGKESEICIIPNPAHSEIVVNLKNIQEGSKRLRILGTSGVIIKEMGIDSRESNSIRVDIQQLLPGLYFLEILGEGSRIRAKFSKI